MKWIDGENIGCRLRRLREQVNMEQEVVARVLEIPRSAVSMYETGKREITVSELIQLCKLFRIAPNDLLNWGSYEKRKSAYDESQALSKSADTRDGIK